MLRDSLYIIQSDFTGSIKIGRSKHPDKRLKELQTGCPYRLKIIYVFKDKGWLENHIHSLLLDFRLKGEWFSYDCVGSIPLSLYEEIPHGSFDDWWVKS